MAISYNKLFELMQKKGIKKIDLRNQYKINPKTVDSLVNNRSVTVDTLMTLCEIFDCQVGDIVEYVKDNEQAAQQNCSPRLGRNTFTDGGAGFAFMDGGGGWDLG